MQLTGYIRAFHINRHITHLHIQITDLIINVIADTETLREAKLQNGDRVLLDAVTETARFQAGSALCCFRGKEGCLPPTSHRRDHREIRA